MPKIIAAVVELAVCACVLWTITFFSTFFHELGHAVGYMLATKDKRWHIRVGWGRRLLNTKKLTVNLLVFDGYFSPSEKKFDGKAKLIVMLLGGPVFSLLLAGGFLALKYSGLSFQSDFFSDGAIEFFLNTALYVNLYLFVLSLAPIRYFYGKVKGLETDGLQIIHAVRRKDD